MRHTNAYANCNSDGYTDGNGDSNSDGYSDAYANRNTDGDADTSDDLGNLHVTVVHAG